MLDYPIVIMKKRWHLLEKILSGQKTVESRWYNSRRCPYSINQPRIKPEDILLFKNSGEPITVKATVNKVEQYDLQKLGLNTQQFIEKHLQHIRDDLGINILNYNKLPKAVKNYITNKRYAIFIWFANVKKLKKPIYFNKSGYGMQNAWICIKQSDLHKITPKIL